MSVSTCGCELYTSCKRHSPEGAGLHTRRTWIGMTRSFGQPGSARRTGWQLIPSCAAAWPAPEPTGQAHVRFGSVRAPGNHLRRRLAVDGPVHLVLHGGEELLGRFLAWVVVNARGVDVEHLAPKHLLQGPDVPDARQQLLEVIAPAAALEPLVVQGEAFDDILPQPLRGSDAKLRAPMRFHPVADRDDDIEIVVLDLVRLAISRSCCKFCNNCFRLQFALLEDVLDEP